MISDKTKLLCLIVFSLTASGCGSSGGDEVSEPLVLVNETISTDGNSIAEVVVGTETSDGLATPVELVSSAEMDKYVKNPLVTTVPSELVDSHAHSVTSSYITNPLIN